MMLNRDCYNVKIVPTRLHCLQIWVYTNHNSKSYKAAKWMICKTYKNTKANNNKIS